MEKNIEIEYKILLTKDQYLEIDSHFTSIAYQQTNFYFDTLDEKLRKLRITLRARLKKEHYEFTLKRFGQIGVDEYNEKISHEDFNRLCSHQSISSSILDILIEDYQISIEDLFQIYSLTTKRKDMPYKVGILSLDVSQYLGIEDYELEYEVSTTQNAIEYFNDFLRPFHLEYHTNCKGKRHRLCDAIENAANQKD